MVAFRLVSGWSAFGVRLPLVRLWFSGLSLVVPFLVCDQFLIVLRLVSGYSVVGWSLLVLPLVSECLWLVLGFSGLSLVGPLLVCDLPPIGLLLVSGWLVFAWFTFGALLYMFFLGLWAVFGCSLMGLWAVFGCSLIGLRLVFGSFPVRVWLFVVGGSLLRLC